MKRDNAGNGSDGPPQKFPRPVTDTSHVMIRFLIPCRAAGIMIGKGGENIKKIRSKDIISAKLSDPRRIMGNYVPRRRTRPGQEQDEPEREDDDDGMLDYRILVHESQAGSVIGRGGERIKELRDSAPPRGRREDYDAGNFCESDALNYGGWLSPDAVRALSQGVPLSRPGGAPPMGSYMNPYMAGNDMGPPSGPMGHMGGMRGPMGGNRGPPVGVRGPRPGGNMMGGPQGNPRSMGNPSPVPPPGAGHRAPSTGNAGGYGGPNQYGNQGGMAGYGAPGAYDNSAMYGGVDQSGQSGYGNQGYGAQSGVNASIGDNYAGAGYGAGGRSANDVPQSAQTAPRGGNYGGYGMAGQGMHEDQKAAQWYGGWA